MKSGKYFKLFLALCLFCLFSIPPSFFATDIKIATVSLQQVIPKSKAGMAAKKLHATVQEFQNKFSKEQEDFETLAADIEKKHSVWSEDVLQAKKHDYQGKYVNLS